MTIGRRILLQTRKAGHSGGGPPAVPPGTIAMWSGTLGTIPANWNLCDGSGVTPNLVAKFLRGAPAATEPGTTGGADNHTHASMTAAGGHTHTAGNLSHQHTVNSAGDHTHDTQDVNIDSGAQFDAMKITTGSHSHVVNSSVAHSHTMDSEANHTHPISTDDGRPPYYEVAFIQAAAGAAVAANLIIIWTGTLANIPAGWSLCDSGGGRPDLRSKFVRGINTNVTNPGTTGGNTTHLHTETVHAAHSHTTNNSGDHNHTFNLYTWTHNHEAGFTTPNVISGLDQTDSGAGHHTHANSDTIGDHNHNPMGNDGAHAHTVNTASSLPVYYDVAYIINDGGAVVIPTNGILVWTDLLANVPAGYNLCDGGGGRPELRAKFLRGSNAAVDPGGGGGADSHTHTDQNAGAHNSHMQAANGAHQHAATDTIGSHTHATSPLSGNAVLDTFVDECNAAGDHSHTYNNEGAHNIHVLTDPGNHVHNPWSTDDGRPAYYEVAFILKA